MNEDILTPSMEKTTSESRKTVRYSSRRIKATATLKQLFLPKRYIVIEVLNISSNGARISTKYKFQRKSKIIFNFKIKGHTTWKIPASIVRLYDNSEYGIVFDSIQHDLIDYAVKNVSDFTISHSC